MDSRDVVPDVFATPDRERFASVSWYKTVYVSDLTTRKQRDVLYGYINRVYCLRISSDGKKAITGSEDDTVHTWHLDSGDGRAETESMGKLKSDALQEIGRYFTWQLSSTEWTGV